MMEALWLLKMVVVAKAAIGIGKTPLLVAGKAPLLLLGVVATLVLFVTLPVVGMSVGLSLLIGAPFARARTTSNSR